jgi:hypothetical protein
MTDTTTPSGLFVDVLSGAHSWSAVSDITAQNRARTGTAPALVRFRGLLYLFHQDVSDRGTVHYCVSQDGSHWSQRVNLTLRSHAVRAAAEVAPIVFRDELYLFFRDAVDPALIKVCHTGDGQEWSPVTPFALEGARCSSRPVPVEYRGSLFVFYRADSGTRGLVACASETGADWNTMVNLEHMTGTIVDEPVPVVHGDRMVVAFRPAQSPSAVPTLASDDGTAWRYGGTITTTSFDTATRPALISHWGLLYAFYVDYVDEGALLVSHSADGVSWYGWRSINGHNRSRETPVPAVWDDRLLLFFRDESEPGHVNVCTKNDHDSWHRYTSISARNHADANGALQVVADEFGIDVGYRSTAYDGTGLAAFHATGPQPWSIRLADVPDAVDAVSTTRGVVKQCAVGDLPRGTDDSIRSMVPYRDWFLVLRDRGPETLGVVDIVDREQQREARAVALPEDGLDHPGGCQSIGDFLAVPVRSEHTHDGCVRFYDLSVVSDTAGPLLLDLRVDLGMAVDAVGITDIGSGEDQRYLLAAYTDGVVSMYESNPVPLSDPRCRFTFRFSCPATVRPRPDAMALLTDARGDVWLVGLGSQESEESAGLDDWITLYRIDLAAGRLTIWSRDRLRTRAPERRFLIHFRFGAGLEVLDSETLLVFAADGDTDNLSQDGLLSYTEFGPPG